MGMSAPMGMLGPSVSAGSAPRPYLHAARSACEVVSSTRRPASPPASLEAEEPELELEQPAQSAASAGRRRIGNEAWTTLFRDVVPVPVLPDLRVAALPRAARVASLSHVWW